MPLPCRSSTCPLARLRTPRSWRSWWRSERSWTRAPWISSMTHWLTNGSLLSRDTLRICSTQTVRALNLLFTKSTKSTPKSGREASSNRQLMCLAQSSRSGRPPTRRATSGTPATLLAQGARQETRWTAQPRSLRGRMEPTLEVARPLLSRSSTVTTLITPDSFLISASRTSWATKESAPTWVVSQDHCKTSLHMQWGFSTNWTQVLRQWMRMRACQSWVLRFRLSDSWPASQATLPQATCRWELHQMYWPTFHPSYSGSLSSRNWPATHPETALKSKWCWTWVVPTHRKNDHLSLISIFPHNTKFKHFL